MNENNNWLSKVLVVSGTILAALPVLAPFILGLIIFISSGQFHFDYLMPAELAFLAFAGGLMLLWAAIRLGTHRWFIAGSLGLAVLMWVGFQAVAEVSGMASGETEPEGLVFGIVIAGLVIYTMAVVALVVWGWRLWRQVFDKNIKLP
ncbi:MAG: hypothetical protein AB9891_04370 [Anaerolineaceae bacterium]